MDLNRMHIVIKFNHFELYFQKDLKLFKFIFKIPFSWHFKLLSILIDFIYKQAYNAIIVSFNSYTCYAIFMVYKKQKKI